MIYELLIILLGVALGSGIGKYFSTRKHLKTIEKIISNKFEKLNVTEFEYDILGIKVKIKKEK